MPCSVRRLGIRTEAASRRTPRSPSTPQGRAAAAGSPRGSCVRPQVGWLGDATAEAAISPDPSGPATRCLSMTTHPTREPPQLVALLVARHLPSTGDLNVQLSIAKDRSA